MVSYSLRLASLLTLTLTSAALVGCGGAAPGTLPGSSSGSGTGGKYGTGSGTGTGTAASSGPLFANSQWTASATPPPTVPRGWRNLVSQLIVRLGDAAHTANDAVVNPGARFELQGKFAYGPTSKDLEGEDVHAFLRVGDRWFALGSAITDSDGRARVPVDAAQLALALGRYEVRWVVAGDGSEATAYVHVIARGTKTVVFDIDGTLTTSDVELVGGVVHHTVGSASQELFDLAGSPLSKAQWLWVLDKTVDPDAELRANARAVVQHYRQRGYFVVLLTGRPYLYDAMTRAWLARHAIPAGALLTVDDVADALPSRVAGFKARALKGLGAAGAHIGAAYGNATTDICAYAEAGVAAAKTFIIGEHGGKACGDSAPSQALRSYGEHLATL